MSTWVTGGLASRLAECRVSLESVCSVNDLEWALPGACRTLHCKLDVSQHQAHLHVMEGFGKLAKRVRTEVWKGCGLWTEH